MTKPAMVKTITDFLSDSEFYDLHLVSTLGYTDEDVEAFAGEDDVRYAEATIHLMCFMMVWVIMNVHSKPCHCRSM